MISVGLSSQSLECTADERGALGYRDKQHHYSPPPERKPSTHVSNDFNRAGSGHYRGIAMRPDDPTTLSERLRPDPHSGGGNPAAPRVASATIDDKDTFRSGAGGLPDESLDSVTRFLQQHDGNIVEERSEGGEEGSSTLGSLPEDVDNFYSGAVLPQPANATFLTSDTQRALRTKGGSRYRHASGTASDRSHSNRYAVSPTNSPSSRSSFSSEGTRRHSSQQQQQRGSLSVDNNSGVTEREEAEARASEARIAPWFERDGGTADQMYENDAHIEPLKLNPLYDGSVLSTMQPRTSNDQQGQKQPPPESPGRSMSTRKRRDSGDTALSSPFNIDSAAGGERGDARIFRNEDFSVQSSKGGSGGVRDGLSSVQTVSAGEVGGKGCSMQANDGRQRCGSEATTDESPRSSRAPRPEPQAPGNSHSSALPGSPTSSHSSLKLSYSVNAHISSPQTVSMNRTNEHFIEEEVKLIRNPSRDKRFPTPPPLPSSSPVRQQSLGKATASPAQASAELGAGRYGPASSSSPTENISRRQENAADDVATPEQQQQQQQHAGSDRRRQPVQKSGSQETLDLAAALKIRDVDAGLDIARSIHPELDSSRIRRALLDTARSLPSFEDWNDAAAVRARCSALERSLDMERERLRCLRSEYRALCHRTEVTQEEHFKLEVLLRKTINEEEERIRSLRMEKEQSLAAAERLNKQLWDHYNEEQRKTKQLETAIQACYKQMTMAISTVLGMDAAEASPTQLTAEGRPGAALNHNVKTAQLQELCEALRTYGGLIGRVPSPEDRGYSKSRNDAPLRRLPSASSAPQQYAATDRRDRGNSAGAWHRAASTSAPARDSHRSSPPRMGKTEPASSAGATAAASSGVRRLQSHHSFEENQYSGIKPARSQSCVPSRHAIASNQFPSVRGDTVAQPAFPTRVFEPISGQAAADLSSASAAERDYHAFESLSNVVGMEDAQRIFARPDKYRRLLEVLSTTCMSPVEAALHILEGDRSPPAPTRPLGASSPASAASRRSPSKLRRCESSRRRRDGEAAAAAAAAVVAALAVDGQRIAPGASSRKSSAPRSAVRYRVEEVLVRPPRSATSAPRDHVRSQSSTVRASLSRAADRGLSRSREGHQLKSEYSTRDNSMDRKAERLRTRLKQLDEKVRDIMARHKKVAAPAEGLTSKELSRNLLLMSRSLKHLEACYAETLASLTAAPNADSLRALATKSTAQQAPAAGRRRSRSHSVARPSEDSKTADARASPTRVRSTKKGEGGGSAVRSRSLLKRPGPLHDSSQSAAAPDRCREAAPGPRSRPPAAARRKGSIVVPSEEEKAPVVVRGRDVNTTLSAGRKSGVSDGARRSEASRFKRLGVTTTSAPTSGPAGKTGHEVVQKEQNEKLDRSVVSEGVISK